MNSGTNRMTRWGAAFVLTMTLAAVSACGGGDDSGVVLSEAGERGKALSSARGCAGCHGGDGQGGVGPKWQGLAGAQVELADGSMVTADEAYLERAIVDPGADLRADYSIQMPMNNLSEAEVADILAFINDLADVGDSSGVSE